MEPESLTGCHVVEVGLRQAWPFVTFAESAGRESRLYIDTVFSVEPAFLDVGDDEQRRLLALAEILMGTVIAASVSADGALSLAFDGIRLVVRGESAPFTTQDNWSLHELQS